MNPLGTPNWCDWFPQHKTTEDAHNRLLNHVRRVLNHKPTNDEDRLRREMVRTVLAVIEIQARAHLNELLFSKTPEDATRGRDETRTLTDLLDLLGGDPKREESETEGGAP